MSDWIRVTKLQRMSECCCEVSLAGHIAKISQSNPEEILRVQNLETICENISKLKTPSDDTDRQLFEHLKLVLCNTKEQLAKTKKKIEMIKSK